MRRLRQFRRQGRQRHRAELDALSLLQKLRLIGIDHHAGLLRLLPACLLGIVLVEKCPKADISTQSYPSSNLFAAASNFERTDARSSASRPVIV